MRATCLIQARMGSTRFPGKVVHELGGRPMLRFMLDRLETLPVERIVVATSDLEADDLVEKIALEAGANVFRGSERDVLGRFAGAAEAFPADLVIRLTADCPFADPEVVARALAGSEYAGSDFFSNTVIRSFPVGLDVEVMSFSALRMAADEALDPFEREHVTPFIYRRPERFRLGAFVSGRRLSHLRWTVDYPEDLDRMRQLLARLGGRTAFSWSEAVLTSADPADFHRDRLAMRSADELDRTLFEPEDGGEAPLAKITTRAKEAAQLILGDPLAFENPARPIWIAEKAGRAVGWAQVQTALCAGVLEARFDDAAADASGLRAFLLALLAKVDGQVLQLRAELDAADAGRHRIFEEAGFRKARPSDGAATYVWTL